MDGFDDYTGGYADTPDLPAPPPNYPTYAQDPLSGAPGQPGTGGAGGIPDWLKAVLGIGGGSGSPTGSPIGGGGLAGLLLGGIGANDIAQRARDQAEFAKGIGAPSRSRYEASMTPGFDPASIPGYSGAVDNAMQAQLRKLSTTGNPFGNPGGLIEANKNVISGTALPAIQAYQSSNAATGGYGPINSSIAPSNLAELLARSNLWNAGGAGLTGLAGSVNDIFGTGGAAGGANPSGATGTNVSGQQAGSIAGGASTAGGYAAWPFAIAPIAGKLNDAGVFSKLGDSPGSNLATKDPLMGGVNEDLLNGLGRNQGTLQTVTILGKQYAMNPATGKLEPV